MVYLAEQLYCDFDGAAAAITLMKSEKEKNELMHSLRTWQSTGLCRPVAPSLYHQWPQSRTYEDFVNKELRGAVFCDPAIAMTNATVHGDAQAIYDDFVFSTYIESLAVEYLDKAQKSKDGQPLFYNDMMVAIKNPSNQNGSSCR